MEQLEFIICKDYKRLKYQYSAYISEQLLLMVNQINHYLIGKVVFHSLRYAETYQTQ